jgi:glutamate N-acetyltransferase/amino-acid N-acetyltransferase
MENLMCQGFLAAGVAAGIKKNSKKDLGIIYSSVVANVAGVFTNNLVKAPCVTFNKDRVKSGKARAIIANSGNANCCTGDKGMEDTVAMAGSVESGLNISDGQVLVASTGVIGEPMPMEKVKAAVPGLLESLSPDGFSDFAHAIMTTDTIPKTVSVSGNIDGKTYTVTGIAKGAGMIRPDMATMLCFVCTDIQAKHDLLQKALLVSTNRSFNKITIDGDTSTNDMVIVMANGLSQAAIQDQSNEDSFQKVLDQVLIKLAKMVVQDGEGANKLVEIVVKGAMSKIDARKVADTVAHSNLVKTAFFGEDANWGRIIAAAGRAEVPIEPDKIDMFFNDVMMVKNGMGCGSVAEAKATKVLKKPEFKLVIDLNMGTKSASVFTFDFSVEYVRINADYRS